VTVTTPGGGGPGVHSKKSVPLQPSGAVDGSPQTLQSSLQRYRCVVAVPLHSTQRKPGSAPKRTHCPVTTSDASWNTPAHPPKLHRTPRSVAGGRAGTSSSHATVAYWSGYGLAAHPLGVQPDASLGVMAAQTYDAAAQLGSL